jgi:hypothetical protein
MLNIPRYRSILLSPTSFWLDQQEEIMKALRNLLLAGAALAPLGAQAQVPIVAYKYPAQQLMRIQTPKQLCSDFTTCLPIVSTGVILQTDIGHKLQYLISAKTTIHNLDGDLQNGTCALFADLRPNWPFPVIIDMTSTGMPEKTVKIDGQSIALQGAFIDRFPSYPLREIGVACTSYNGDVRRTVLTVIPFQPSPPFNCPDNPNLPYFPGNDPGNDQGGPPLFEQCTPKNVD